VRTVEDGHLLAHEARVVCTRCDAAGSNRAVKTPSAQPWGNRSIYLRDTDGNLVNLYTRVPAEKEKTTR